jgi:hypothetical protein
MCVEMARLYRHGNTGGENQGDGDKSCMLIVAMQRGIKKQEQLKKAGKVKNLRFEECSEKKVSVY